MSKESELIKSTLAELKRVPGALNKFYEALPKSRSVVSAWVHCKAKPSPTDFEAFVSTATDVLRKSKDEFTTIQAKTERAVADLRSLLSA